MKPVVEKIEITDFEKYEDDCFSYLFTINRIHSFIEKIKDVRTQPFIQIIIDNENQLKRENTAINSLEATYKAVIEFIKWYNKQ